MGEGRLNRAFTVSQAVRRLLIDGGGGRGGGGGGSYYST